MDCEPDVKIEPLTGNIHLNNGIYRGLHRQFVTIHDERPSGEHGGSAISGKWMVRTFTTISGLCNIGVGLVENQFIIAPGTYHIEANAPGLGIGHHQIRWQNVSDGITEAFGTSEISASDECSSRSVLSCRLCVTSDSKVYELQHRCSHSRPHDGLGRAAGFSNSLEVYAVVNIYRLN